MVGFGVGPQGKEQLHKEWTVRSCGLDIMMMTRGGMVEQGVSKTEVPGAAPRDRFRIMPTNSSRQSGVTPKRRTGCGPNVTFFTNQPLETYPAKRREKIT